MTSALHRFYDVMAIYITLRFTKSRHGALYHAPFYIKSVIGRYITLLFTKIEMSSLWGQYTKKVILMLPIHKADISCHCIINEIIWYMCCDMWYILSTKKYGSAEYWYIYIIRQQEEMLNIPPVKTRSQESGSTLFAILHSSLIRIYTICHSQQSDQGQGLHCHSREQSDQGLQYLPFSAVWSGSTLLAILSSLISLIRVNTICHSQQSYQGLHYFALSAVWSRPRYTLLFSGTVWSGYTQFAIRSSLIKVYTVCHSQQCDQGLHCLPFSAVLSRPTLFAILSSQNRVYTVCHSQQSDQGLHCLPFSAVWSGSKLFAIISSLIKDYTVCHSQQSDQGLHYMPFFLSSIIKGYTVLSFSAIWTGSTLLAILSSLIKVNVYTVILRNSLIRVYTICHSQQSNHGLRCLPFSSVWSGSTLFTILSSLIKVKVYTVILRNILIRFYTICHSQQSDQGQGLHCHSQEQTDQVLQYLPFSAAWSRSTHAILSSQIRVSLLAILNSLIKVYTVCHSQQPV